MKVIRKIIRLKLTIVMVIGFLISTFSYKSSTDNQTKENESVIQNEQADEVDNKAELNSIQTSDTTHLRTKKDEFVESLKNGDGLSKYFSNNWTLIYHEDNRCDGSTDGQIDNLSNSQIDMVIELQVKNDGDGWACDKKEPKSFDLNFNLKDLLKNWDMFEIPNYENQGKNIVYVVGAGESDYLKLHYDINKLIVKIEDPG